MTQDRTKPGGSSEGPKPKATVGRLSLYLRHLEQLAASGQEAISSTKLGQALDISDAQVRKDLGYFGQFGQPGVGYPVRELRDSLRQVLGTHRQWNVALIGVGNLGRALLNYGGFRARGFLITDLFDSDPALIGTPVDEWTIHSIDELPVIAKQRPLELAVLSVPAHAAHQVAQNVQEAGIAGILNFAPTTLTVPKPLSVVSVDLGLELEQLAFHVSRRHASTDNAEPPP